MPRGDSIDTLRGKYDFLLMKSKIQAKIDEYTKNYELAIAELKQELNAVAVLEKSKHLSFEPKETPSQASLFSKPTLKERMISSLSAMPEKFKRQELFDAVKKDGKPGKVNEGSLSVYFPILIKEGYFELDPNEKTPGNQPGYYIKCNKTA